MSREERHAEALKAFEAQLASLVPRTDRLDRERLIFLAGRESAVRSSRVATPLRRWAWPAALAAMTAVAASLLVMLATQPGPQVIVQVVERPAADATAGSERAVPPSMVDPSDEPTEPAMPYREVAPDREYGRGILAMAGLSWPRYSAERRSPRSAYLRLLEQTLEGRVEPSMVSVRPQDGQRVAPPISQRELLEKLLKNPTQEKPRRDAPATAPFFNPGANS